MKALCSAHSFETPLLKCLTHLLKEAIHITFKNKNSVSVNDQSFHSLTSTMVNVRFKVLLILTFGTASQLTSLDSKPDH